MKGAYMKIGQKVIYHIDGKKYMVWRGRLKDELEVDCRANPIRWFAQKECSADISENGWDWIGDFATKRELFACLGCKPF
jgi:hypothetical protein